MATPLTLHLKITSQGTPMANNAANDGLQAAIDDLTKQFANTVATTVVSHLNQTAAPGEPCAHPQVPRVNVVNLASCDTARHVGGHKIVWTVSASAPVKKDAGPGRHAIKYEEYDNLHLHDVCHVAHLTVSEIKDRVRAMAKDRISAMEQSRVPKMKIAAEADPPLRVTRIALHRECGCTTLVMDPYDGLP